MKTYRVYVLAAEGRDGISVYQKMFLVALILALLFASLPATHVLAASAGGQDITEDNTLKQEWSNKLNHLRYEGLWYNRVRLYPADFENLSDLTQAQYYLDQYGIALRQANTVVFNHTGFDIKGRILNVNQADQSVHELAMYLQMMRGFREKLAEVPNRR